MKRAYRKPELKIVKLAPEEAVLAGCKITLDASGGRTRCREATCTGRARGS